MRPDDILRKDLDDQHYMKLRQNTQKITQLLEKRLKGYLNTLRPLFTARKLLGNYVKSAVMDEIPGSDKAFAELQAKFSSICEKPFGLPKKLQTPLPPISNQLEATAFKYSIDLGESSEQAVTIMAATRWIISYHTECPFDRLKAMVSGSETRHAEQMKQSLIDHLTLVILLDRFPALTQLFRDLRYEVGIHTLDDLGGLPVVILTAPLESFLPPDDFIVKITQFSGIPAFQEIVDEDAVDNIFDPLKEELSASVGS